MTDDKDGGEAACLGSRSRRSSSTSISPRACRRFMQIVQQVEHALRLGYLSPGDQLPKVRDVVAQLAINPNTVMKAYRELEMKGLAVGRPGQGTFIEATLNRVALPVLTELRRSLVSWVATADAAGLDEDGINALMANVMRDFRERGGGAAHRRGAGATRGGGSGMNVIETHALGKSYGQTRALHDCTLAIPEGHVVALVGPNGAGKTTLLNLAVGLAVPTSGEVTVLGGRPAGSPSALDGIAFVAQNTPLYKNLSAADLLHETRNLNRRFDQGYAEHRLDELGIPLRQKAGEMSGGQQAQLALTLALARRPQLLVLDEPMASLDPLARIDFMATVMAAVADDGVSVVLSSHILAELERVCDYLVLLSRGRIQVVGEVEDLLAHHRVLTGPVFGVRAVCAEVERRACQPAMRRGCTSASAATAPLIRYQPGWEARPITLEELTIAYLREPDAAALPGPSRGRAIERSELAK